MTDWPGEVELAGANLVLPPEWYPHSATWMSWPHNLETWPRNLPQAQQEFQALIAAIARDEPVMLLADPEQTCLPFQPGVQNGFEQVTVLPIKTNDAWIRDYGPTFVFDCASSRLAAIDWKYNAWGGKYPPFDDDQQVTVRIAQSLPEQPHVIRPPLILEGGAIEIDQDGILLTTINCVLNPNRNPQAKRDQISGLLTRTLGAQSVIWLTGDGIAGDDTDGHIDQLARFTPDGSVLVAWDDDNPGLIRNRRDLQTGFRQLGIERRIIPLPLPDPVIVDNHRLPASYCNFYVTLRSVLVPQFGCRQDQTALQIIDQEFPDHDTIGLPSLNLTVGLGSFHCLTQQQPALNFVDRTPASTNVG